MTTPNPVQELHDVRDRLRNFDGEVSSFRRYFEGVRRIVPFAEAMVVTSLPRAGAQILQCEGFPAALAKKYQQEGYLHDRATWQAAINDRAMEGRTAWPKGEFESGVFFKTMMQERSLKYLACAPLQGPLLQGYFGALQLFRRAADGDFTAGQLRLLGEAASALNQATEHYRQTRRRGCSGGAAPWEAVRPVRQFIFDAAGRQLFPPRSAPGLEEPLRSALKQEAISRLASLKNGRKSRSLVTPDQHGELLNFNEVAFEKYAALASGPVVFFCLQPDVCEWSTLRPADFHADAEMSKMVPALRFMHQEFGKGPRLGEIAGKANLSPFHFHRRFSELLGQTPKRYLLDCQIRLCKSDLVQRKKPLRQIAADCGFAHQSHFTSRFRQATGLTPTHWRRLFAPEKASEKPARPSGG